MNDFQKIEILHELINELPDTLIVSMLLAIKNIKNGDYAGADERLRDAIKAIESIRDRFFI